jgi:hypothetical protein
MFKGVTLSNETEKLEPRELSGLESELYSTVENFFRNEKNCDKTGSAGSFPISLQIFGGTIFPDVFGLRNPSKPDYEVFMAEGKRSFRGRDFDECKGQAISLQRFADYVYTFFPKAAWDGLTSEEQIDVKAECESLQLGLLIIDKDKCEERVKPSRKDNLVKEEKRQFARNKIVQFFPDFLGVKQNTTFFDNYVTLADNILQECFNLFSDLVGCVSKVTGVSKQSIKHEIEDSFEFYLRSEAMDNGRVNLLIKPFGSPDLDINRPILIVEEIYNRSLLNKVEVDNRLLDYIDECLKSNFRLKTKEMIVFNPDTLKDAVNYISQSKYDEFRIHKPIEINGLEKKAIEKVVEKSVKNSIEFMRSLGIR